MRMVLIAVSCVLLISGIASAQSDRGTITGTVSDPAGAVVSGASIEAKNSETGSVYQVASTATGNYTLSQLPAGTYQLTVTIPGFKQYVRQGITVLVAQTLRIDIGLEVGAPTETITVNADAPLLKTESGELSHTVKTQLIDDLPILGIGTQASGTYGLRNPFSVTQLLPGTYFGSNSTIRVNGALSNSYSLRIEGQDATNGLHTASTVQTQPSVDAIQEVTIQTSNYAAEYGQVGGGYFNFTTKSGTNQPHGSVYDYMMNEALNASQPYTNLKDVQRRHDYGFTIGGPVYIPRVYDGHDKTFFFFNFEQFRQDMILQTTAQTVPTPAFRAGDFSSILTGRQLNTDPLGRPIMENAIYDSRTSRVVSGQVVRDTFPNNRIPQELFDPVAVKVQALIPLPMSSGLTNNYLNPILAPRVTYVPAVKIDQSVGTKGKLSFYWSQTTTWNQYNIGNAAADGLPNTITAAIGNFITAHTMRLNYDHTLRPTLLLHLGAGFLYHHFNEDAPVLNYDSYKELGLKGQTIVRNFPRFGSLLAAQGGMVNMGPGAQLDAYNEKPTFNASLTWVKDNHTYKAGAEFRTEGYPLMNYTWTNMFFNFAATQSGLPSTNGQNLAGGNVGFPYASFLLGLVDNGNGGVVSEPRLGKKQFGIYVQDTWKVTRKFTLDYGLRYDYSTYLKEQYGRFPSFSPTVKNPADGGLPGGIIFEGNGAGHCNCEFAHNYPWAFGPRLGAAYQITPRTVLRAGWGIVYAGTSLNAYFTQTGASNVPFTSPAFGEPGAILKNGLPLTPQQLAWPNFDPGYLNIPNSIPNVPTYFDPNAGRPARQVQWSIGLQRELSKNFAIEVSYVGNRGVWWQANALVNYSALTAQSLAARGLDISSAADRALLASRLDSSTAAARGFNKAPYAGFPLSSTVAQSLRPFPQYNNIPASFAPLGNTWYDSLQAKATKRLSSGLEFTSVFTWQKELQIGAESDSMTAGSIGAVVNDVFDRRSNKYISGQSRPFTFITSINYMFPKLGINKVLSVAIRDWQVGAVLQYASGLPIRIPASNNALATILFRGTYANRVPGQPLFTVDPNCHCFDPNTTFLLNPKAWTDPPAGQFGTSALYFNDYRGPRRPQENMSLARNFRIKERANLQIRVEFSNVFNRPYYNFPTSTNAAATQTRNSKGQTTSGFGYINVQVPIAASFAAVAPRAGTIVARFAF
jgi:hypothetical protein